MSNPDNSGPDTLARVLDDASAMLCYDAELTHQRRAHEYIRRRRVQRGFVDTATECAVSDLVRRAHAVGVRDGRGQSQALAEVPAPPVTLREALRMWWAARRG